MYLQHIKWVIALWVSVLVIAAIWPANPIPTTRDGAVLALQKIEEWSKWMAGIETAAIAGLVVLIFDEHKKLLTDLPPLAPSFALSAFLFLGSALLCSAWIFSSLPSHAIRIYERQECGRAAVFDVYEQPLYSWAEKGPTLGYVLNVNHWLWVIGLLSLGAVFAMILGRAASCK